VFDLFIHLVRAEGVAALVATHNADLAAKMDRQLLLHDGRLVEGLPH
jgi:lipoprotein-releasing system ATP-binding protein